MPVTLSTQMYQAETAHFLSMFDGQADGKSPEEKVREIFKTQIAKLGISKNKLTDDEQAFGVLHPVVIAEALARGMKFSESDSRQLDEIIRKTYPTDQTTEFNTKQGMPTIVGLAHLCAKETSGLPVCMVEGDFTNIAGCNKHFAGPLDNGTAVTDKLIHEVSGIVKRAFADRAKSVEFVRAGGDEVRLVVFGMEKTDVDDILRKVVHPQINLLAAKFGVHNIEHTKEGKFPGFGAAFASVDLKKAHSPSEISTEINTMIGHQKMLDGQLRIGMVDAEGIKRYIEIYRKELQSQDFDDAQINQRIKAITPDLTRYAVATKSRWDELMKAPGEYRTLAAKYKTHKPYEFFNRHAEETAASRSNEFAHIKIQPLPPSRHRVPFWSVPLERKEVEDPEMLRIRKALKAFHFHQSADVEGAQLFWNRETHRHELTPDIVESDTQRQRLKQLIVDLMDAYHAPDPSTRCKSTSLMIEDAKDYLHTHKNGMRVLQFEVTNLSGLNSVNYHLADAVLRETGKYIKQALEKYPDADYMKYPEHMSDHVYYEGNGKFKAFVPEGYTKMNQVEKAVAKSFNDHIASKDVLAFASSTYMFVPKPPRKEKTSAVSPAEANALYEQQMAAYIARVGQYGIMASALKEELRNLSEKQGARITTVSTIRHPKKDKDIPVGIRHYNYGIMDNKTPADAGLARVSTDAEIYFTNSDKRHR